MARCLGACSGRRMVGRDGARSPLLPVLLPVLPLCLFSGGIGHFFRWGLLRQFRVFVPADVDFTLPIGANLETEFVLCCPAPR